MYGNSFTNEIDEAVVKFSETTLDITKKLKKLNELSTRLDCIKIVTDYTLEDIISIINNENDYKDLNDISLKIFNKNIKELPITDLITCLYYFTSGDVGTRSSNVIMLPNYYNANNTVFNLKCNKYAIYLTIYRILDRKFSEEQAIIEAETINDIALKITKQFYDFKSRFLTLWNNLGPLLCSKFGIDPNSIVEEVMNYSDWKVYTDDLVFTEALYMICDKDDEEEAELRKMNLGKLICEYERKSPYSCEYYMRVYPKTNADGKHVIAVNNWSNECLLIKFLDLNVKTKFDKDANISFSNMIESINTIVSDISVEDARKLTAMAYIVIYPELTLEEAMEAGKKNLPDNE